MTVSAVRRAGWWRWLVVAAGTAVLVSLPGLIAALPVSVAAVPVRQLYARMAASAGQPYHGFALSSGTAGLPTLPQLADAIALLNGETQLRVWYGGPDRWRVDQVGVGTERDLYQQPDGQTLWDFGTDQLTSIVGAQPVRLPRGADLVPPDLARRIIALVGPDPAGLAPLPARSVAGIAADGLRLTPDDPLTTVGRVDFWADPTTGLPLQVEISGRGAGAPILVSRFLDLDLSPPDPATLVPPTGGPDTAHVVTRGSDIAQAFRTLRLGPLPTTLGGDQRTDDPATSVGVGVYGTGLTSFLVIPVPRQVGIDAFNQVEKAGGRLVTLPAGAGVVVATPLITLMVMDSDPARRRYLLIGFVAPSVLQRAGADLSTFVGRRPS